MHRLVLVFAFIVQFPSGVRQHQAVKLDQLGTRALESPDHAVFQNTGLQTHAAGANKIKMIGLAGFLKKMLFGSKTPKLCVIRQKIANSSERGMGVLSPTDRGNGLFHHHMSLCCAARAAPPARAQSSCPGSRWFF